MERVYPKSAAEFLDAAQQYVLETGSRIQVLDGSKELLFLFGTSEKEWAFRLSRIKNRGFNQLLTDHFLPGKRETLAEMISDMKCLRPFGAEVCRCGADFCIVSEVLLT